MKEGRLPIKVVSKMVRSLVTPSENSQKQLAVVCA